MLCPISRSLEAHLWAIAVASIRVHGGLLVSGLGCIRFLLLSALGFFLCSLWIKGCTCAHLKGREFTTSRNLWPMKGESHEEILSSTLVSGSKFWGAFHMVLAGPPKQWDPIPTMIVSSTTLFLLLSCFALCIPNKILLEGYFPRSVRGLNEEASRPGDSGSSAGLKISFSLIWASSACFQERLLPINSLNLDFGILTEHFSS